MSCHLSLSKPVNIEEKMVRQALARLRGLRAYLIACDIVSNCNPFEDNFSITLKVIYIHY